jgi:HK97 family phage major capsid protein
MIMAAKTEIQTLTELTQKNSESINALTKALGDVTTKLSKMPAAGHPDPRQVFGVPGVRHGEDPFTSRGFSFGKMLGVITGAVPPEEAKVEIDIHNRLHNVFVKGASAGTGYQYAGRDPGLQRGAFLAPLATNFFQESMVDNKFRQEMKALIRAGTDGTDPNEATWIRKKVLEQHGYGAKTLSWLNELTGGALVAPPDMGELIELLRNKEALVNAGARVVPLPPQGRLKYPRQTAASLTYWVGENTKINDSDIGTGEVTLQAKKLAVLIKAPNELLRFASPAAEALMRDDMTKSLALGLDLAGLEGAGGDHRPRGILNHPNINRITSGTPGANGDKLVGQDIYRMIAAIEESNAEMEGFIMRPKTLYKYYQLRSDAVAQGDGQGPFLFNLIREPSEAMGKASLAGFPVTKSTQVSQSRSKGSATNLTYIIWGMWSDLLIGMFGAIEFAATTLGDTAFQYDQTWVRGILSADIAVRHEAAFGLMDNLDVVNL